MYCRVLFNQPTSKVESVALSCLHACAILIPKNIITAALLVIFCKNMKNHCIQFDVFTELPVIFVT